MTVFYHRLRLLLYNAHLIWINLLDLFWFSNTCISSNSHEYSYTPLFGSVIQAAYTSKVRYDTLDSNGINTFINPLWYSMMKSRSGLILLTNYDIPVEFPEVFSYKQWPLELTRWHPALVPVHRDISLLISRGRHFESWPADQQEQCNNRRYPLYAVVIVHYIWLLDARQLTALI